MEFIITGVCNPTVTKKFLKSKSLLNTCLIFVILHDTLNYVKGIIYVPCHNRVSEEEIINKFVLKTLFLSTNLRSKVRMYFQTQWSVKISTSSSWYPLYYNSMLQLLKNILFPTEIVLDTFNKNSTVFINFNWVSLSVNMKYMLQQNLYKR